MTTPADVANEEHDRPLMPSETLMLMQADDQAARDDLMSTYRARRNGLWPNGWRAHLDKLGVDWGTPSKYHEEAMRCSGNALEVHEAALMDVLTMEGE